MITRAVLRQQLNEIEAALAELKVRIHRQQLLLRAMDGEDRGAAIDEETASLTRMEEAVRLYTEDRERVKDVLAHAREKGL